MNILHILSQIHPTGAENHAATLIKYQRLDGHKAFIISDKLHVEIDAEYLQMKVHDLNLIERIKAAVKVRSFIIENDIHIVHCHSRAASKVGSIACNALRLKNGDKVAYVSTIHGRQPISFSKKLVNIYGHKQISICNALSENLITRLGISANKVSTIYNPIEIKPDQPHKQFSGKIKEVAWVGRFNSFKGKRLEILILEVLPSLLEQAPDLRIHLVGGQLSELGESARNAITELNLKFGNRIIHRGYVKDIDSSLIDFDLVIGAGRVAMNALMLGVPVFALGEYNVIGLITLQNYVEAKFYNFGDIGVDGQPTMKKCTGNKLEKFQFIFDETINVTDLELLKKWSNIDFSASNIHRRVMNVYFSSRGRVNYKKNIPVLMYHKIPDVDLNSRHKIYVNKRNFEDHLKCFKSWGMQSVTFSDLQRFRSAAESYKNFPKKPFIITFDDGYKDNLKNAGPLLKHYGFCAVIYLLANQSIDHNYWDMDGSEPRSELLSAAERKELIKNFPFEVGSHGFTHEKLTQIESENRFEEVANSKAHLEQEFNTQVVSFAFTYGVRVENSSQLVESAGYLFAVNTDSGASHFEDDTMNIFRVNIFPNETTATLKKKCSSWYRMYSLVKKGR